MTHFKRPRADHWLALLAAVLFAISAVFPAGACMASDTKSFSRWWGVADVSTAFILAAVAMVVLARGQRLVDGRVEGMTYRAYRVFIHGLLAAIVLILLTGDHVTWTNCLPGFAWRAWLLLYGLPSWIALRTREEAEGYGDADEARILV